jgi:cytochrome oxidase Cu insertion factor (SCO1/SenC/PrrC family)
MASAHPSPPRFTPFAAGAFGGWLGVTALWWALAFAPLPVPADWLARAREVCFGTLPNGLPDTWGWMLLVLGPLSMLAFLVAVWGSDLAASARWLARRRAGAALLAGLVLAVAAAGGWLSGRVAQARELASAYAVEETGEPLPEHYPRGTEPAPALGLVDQQGARVELADLAGRPAIVTFAFAHCVTVCPVLVHSLRRASELLPEESQPALLVVTLDPWRDTPGSLPGIVEAWGLDRFADARVLSGGVDEVERVRENWGVLASRDESTGEIVHPALVFVVDDRGRLAYRFLNPPPGWLAEAVGRIAADPA